MNGRSLWGLTMMSLRHAFVSRHKDLMQVASHPGEALMLLITWKPAVHFLAVLGLRLDLTMDNIFRMQRFIFPIIQQCLQTATQIYRWSVCGLCSDISFTSQQGCRSSDGGKVLWRLNTPVYQDRAVVHDSAVHFIRFCG